MNSEIAKSRIGEVIRIDTVTSTQADFLATHVPVQNIRSCPSHERPFR